MSAGVLESSSPLLAQILFSLYQGNIYRAATRNTIARSHTAETCVILWPGTQFYKTIYFCMCRPTFQSDTRICPISFYAGYAVCVILSLSLSPSPSNLSLIHI